MLDKRLNAFRDDLADIRLKGRIGAARFVDGTSARITLPLAPLRRAPRDDAALETQGLMGERVRVFDTDAAGWSFVQLEADSYVGYLPANALGAMGEEPGLRVGVPSTLLFPEPDIKRPPLALLPMGAVLAPTGEASDHNASYALVAPQGAVVRQHLVGLDQTASDFVTVAERLTHAPYLWGGKSAWGIDCSGLVQLSLGMAGMAAPRDTDLQAAGLGTALAPGEPPRRGDLVFWRGHVGIMTDAETLLHANAFHMMVASEPLAAAIARMEARGAPVTGIRRLDGLPA